MAGSPMLITGIAGQDGQLLAQRLSEAGCHVVGVVLPESDPPPAMLTGLSNVSLVEADLGDADTCRQVIAEHQPATIFHLAAISSVSRSWDAPVLTTRVNAMSTVALMAECLDLAAVGREIRFVNASSGEIFAGSGVVPQTERTPLAPTSPYGVTKAFGHSMAQTMRARGLWASNAILYNHESPLRRVSFVTRKITSGVAAIASGRPGPLRLGNLDARRDFGWAPDYVDCLLRIAAHHRPDDFVVATGVSHSVRDFVAAAFSAVGIDDWNAHVEIDPAFLRPADSAELIGDATKARTELGWVPTKSFEEIVAAMVLADLSEFGQADHRPAPTGTRGSA